MRTVGTDSLTAAIGVTLNASSEAGRSSRLSEIECEVMRLFEESRDPLLRYALSLGLPVDDAEEVIQECFLSLFRHLQLCRPRQNLRGWLFRVTHNLALKRRHANQRSRETTSWDWSIAEMLHDPGPNPEECAAFTQKRRRLLAVLKALPDLDRCCITLRAEGLRYREIADVLGISLGAVSLSISRSLARLMRAEGD